MRKRMFPHAAEVCPHVDLVVPVRTEVAEGGESGQSLYGSQFASVGRETRAACCLSESAEEGERWHSIARDRQSIHLPSNTQPGSQALGCRTTGSLHHRPSRS